MRHVLAWSRKNRQEFFPLYSAATIIFLVAGLSFAQKRVKPLPPHVPGYVIVKMKSSADPKQSHTAAALRLLQRFGATELRPIFPGEYTRSLARRIKDGGPLPDLALYYKLIFAPSSDVAALCAHLQASGLVEYAEPDFICHYLENESLAGVTRAVAKRKGMEKLAAYTPNDPRFNEQGWLQQVKAPQAWDTVRADSTVIVGLVDSGFDFDHPDLAQSIWVNAAEDLNHNGRFDEAPASAGGDEDGLDNDNNGFIDDVVGWDFVGRFLEVIFHPDNFPQAGTGFGGSHGVSTAGCVAAIGDNNFGIVGAGFRCQLMFTKHGSDVPSGGDPLNTSVYFYAEGLMYQALAGADIINMSFGATGYSQFQADMVEAALRMGVLLVAAAGNGGEDGVGDDNEMVPYFPASFPGVLAVGAVQSNNRKSGFSNYGRPQFVQLFAPGENVLTLTDPNNPSSNGQQFDFETGTSFSTPIVAGIAALLKQQNPQRTGGEIYLQLCGTADNLDAVSGNLAGRMGYGLVNAERAVTAPTVVFPPDIALLNVKVRDDLGGNGNGLWEAGETAGMEIRLRNLLGNAENVQVQLQTEHWAVEVLNGTTTIASFPGLPDYSNSYVTIPAAQLTARVRAEALPASVPFRLRVSSGAYSEEFSFNLTILPSILFVDDDDGNNNIEGFYLEAFEQYGIGADYWNHSQEGTPPVALMQQYSTVVWACEWAFPSLDAGDRAALSQYLEGGGNLFVSGQDIGWDLCEPEPGVANEFSLSNGASLDFYEKYLHARYLVDDSQFSSLSGVSDDPIGAGLNIHVFQPGRTSAEQFPSEIAALAPAVSVFNYPNNASGAVRTAGNARVVYFAFGGYEAIVEADARSTVMPRVLNWLNGVAIVHTPLRDTEDSTAARPVFAHITSLVSPLASVALYWDTDDVPPFNRIPMIEEGNDNYSASIPAQSNKTVKYFVLAQTQNHFSSPVTPYAYTTQPDHVPPQLSNLTEIPNGIRLRAHYPVAVEANDNVGIDSSAVAVLFRRGASALDSVLLRPATSSGRYEGNIPGSFTYGDTVYYQAHAQDLAVAQNRGVSESKSFVVGLEDFENGIDDWNVSSEGWGLSTTARFSGRYSANQSPQTTNYEQNLNTALTLAFPLAFSQVGDAQLTFAELHFFQANQEDFGVVEISSDGGENWSKLSEEFRGLSTGWLKKTYALANFTGAAFPDVRLRFRVQTDAQPQVGRRGWFVDDIQLMASGTVAVKEPQAPATLPSIFALHQNYPNPFAQLAATQIRFDLAAAAEVEITIYDLLGQRVALLASGRKTAGTHVLHWQGRDNWGKAVTPGVYFCRLRAVALDSKREFVQIRKMMLLH